MKKILLNKCFWLVLFDIGIIPVCIFCRWLSDQMLSVESVCLWTIYGGKCLTCGGTHFVNSLLKGHIIDAFHHNQLLFGALIVFLIILVLLHLSWIFKVRFAKKVLSLPFFLSLIVLGGVSTVLFFLIRNIPMFVYFINLGFSYAEQILSLLLRRFGF